MAPLPIQDFLRKMNPPKYVPKANRPPGTKTVDSVDTEPWEDIKDAEEDKEMHPDDWMKKIFLDEEQYDDLLTLLETQLKAAIPWIHPNKVLRKTLRHLVLGDTCTDADEPAILLAAQVITTCLKQEYQVPGTANRFLSIASEFEGIWDVKNCMGAFAGRQIKSEHFDISASYIVGVDAHWYEADYFTICMVDARLRILYFVSMVSPQDSTYGELLEHVHWATDRNTPGYFPAPSAPKGSQKKLPYTFVGGKLFPAASYMRVPTTGNKEENQEIERGVMPSEIAMDMIVSRFGLFQVKHGGFEINSKLVTCIPPLHNYFLRTNPAYADLNQLLKDYKNPPAGARK